MRADLSPALMAVVFMVSAGRPRTLSADGGNREGRRPETAVEAISGRPIINYGVKTRFADIDMASAFGLLLVSSLWLTATY